MPASSHGRTLTGDRRLNICIINFTGDRQNWGCQATSWELVRMLRSASPTPQGLSFSYVPLLSRCEDDAPEAVDHGELQRVMRQACSAGPRQAASLDRLVALAETRYGAYAEMVKRSDLVVFQAEGTMAGTDFVRGARLLLLPVVAKMAWGKPVLALNQTIMTTPEFAATLTAVYAVLDAVAVREPASLQVARSLGLSNVIHIPDAAFLTASNQTSAEPSPRDAFAVTGTAWFGPHAHEQIFRAADQIRHATGLRPVIAVSTAADGKLAELAACHWSEGDYDLVPSHLSYLEMVERLRECRFLLGGRYHMAIMAACVGVSPILVRGNSYKNEGLAALLGMGDPVHDPADEAAIVAEGMRKANPRRGDAELAAAVQEVRAALQESCAWLGTWMAGEVGDVPRSARQPPGRPVELSDIIDLYLTNAVQQAAAFEYGPRPAEEMKPTATAPAADRGGRVSSAPQRLAASPQEAVA